MYLNLNKMKTLLTFFLLILFNSATFSQKFFIDADTGNEMDDLYAITYLLGLSDKDVIALSAAHFNNPDLLTEKTWNGYKTKGIKTMEESFILNKKLLEATHREDVDCLKGATKMIGRAWGGTEPRSSAASQRIIKEARNASKDEPLVVFTLGPLTNVASAIIEVPEIEEKIVLYMMGANYYEDKNAWDKSEFNIRNDLNAFNYLLDSKVEMHIMTASTSYKFKFNKNKSLKKHSKNTSLDKLLLQKWVDVGAGEEWIMWDLAMLIAYFKPDWATEIQVNTPPVNRQRKVYVYTDLDAKKMEDHFWDIYNILN